MLLKIQFLYSISRVQDSHFFVKIGQKHLTKSKSLTKNERISTSNPFYPIEYIKRK